MFLMKVHVLSGVLLLNLAQSVLVRSEIVKRSDDVVPLEHVVERLSADLQSLQASLTALQAKVDRLDDNVSFRVGFTRRIVSGLNEGVVLKFDDVLYNAGNGYNAITGIFTAPASGVYAFFFKVETIGAQSKVLAIVHQGKRVGFVFGDDPSGSEMVSTLEVLHVNQGEKVWVQAVDAIGNNHDIRGSDVTRFVGFLVHSG